MTRETRWLVGIDLGTTNCAVARTAADGEEGTPIETEPVPQLVHPGEVAERPLLPSFMYVPGPVDFPAGSLALPWDPGPRVVVGELARSRGAENPVRLVTSAKSWLSHGGSGRTAPILPWGAPPEVEKHSPVEVSAAYLRYLREAWNHRMAAGAPRLEAQEILLTVPASFDEAARELTLQAAAAAGLEHVTLLEEPQAAFYAWIAGQGERWRRSIAVGDLILVCDIGGGTTDFSLIAVSERDGALDLERVAVGDHILLGGDNMDLALARRLQQRLEGEGHRLDTWQLHRLWHQCRAGKEALLADAALAAHPVALLGSGTRLVGGTIKTELRREDVDEALIDGFFPFVEPDAMPARARRVGLQELGLPYAADAAVTRHLARFLSRQAEGASGVRRGPGGLACPTHLLFNGGVFKAPALRQRLLEVINTWLRREGFEALDPARVLGGTDLDHAVAVGAAYYGRTRAGRGVRIRSGASRSYYIGVESAMPAVPGVPAPLKALCVVPFGMEEGTRVSIPREFGLVVGEPAEFRFLSSTLRKTDPPGALVEDWAGELEELDPLEVTLDAEGETDVLLPVTLESHVTEVGTLEVWCVASDRPQRWRLQLNIRERDAAEAHSPPPP